jgi:hypothetical protein
MRCGNCKKDHDTVAKVRECYGKGSAEGGQVYANLSGTQQRYLGDLLAQFNLILADDMTPEKIDYHSGKRILDGLIAARRLKATGKSFTFPDGVKISSVPVKGGARTPRRKRLPECPPGYYAVPDWTGKEELRFFRVKIRAKGDWKGWTFVDEVIGGRPERHCDYKLSVEAIKAILEFGVEDAGMLYGIKIKQCYNCNRSLTKKASRALSLGRHCAYLKNKGEEWDKLNANFNDADAEDDD